MLVGLCVLGMVGVVAAQSQRRASAQIVETQNDGVSSGANTN